MRTSPLHVALDCRVVAPRYPGIGRATRETARAMATGQESVRLSLLAQTGHVDATIAALTESSNVDLVEVPAALRSPADQLCLPMVLGRLRPDLYHAPYFAVPVLAGTPLMPPVVVTLYDLIPLLLPDRPRSALERLVIQRWIHLAATRATRIVVPSEQTAADLRRFLPAVTPKIRVVPLGVTPGVTPHKAPRGGPRPALPKAAGSERYLLYVGSNKPHKNLLRLIEAFAALDEPRYRLVIAGAWDRRYPESAAAVTRLNLGDRVTFYHDPDDEALDSLYAGAHAFVFPSLYEGFGLPVLEAMAAGLPVATSERGALRDVAGQAALTFDPRSREGMSAALSRLIGDQDLRRRLKAAALAQAARFSWERTARELCHVYEEI